MIAEVFVDTNVLLYSIDDDPAAAAKRQRSPKRPFRLSAGAALALVEGWFLMPTQDLTPAVFRAAVDLQQRFGINYWDAAILAAAKTMGCATVYSEDLNDGQIYDGVTVVNPFKLPAPPANASGS